MNDFETIEADSLRVACDGGDEPLGHPRVFLQIDTDAGDVVCPYCSRRYVLKEGAKIAAGH